MLSAIRDAVKDDSTVYLFLDRASFHRNPDVKDVMKDLDIKPVFNVCIGPGLTFFLFYIFAVLLLGTGRSPGNRIELGR